MAKRQRGRSMTRSGSRNRARSQASITRYLPAAANVIGAAIKSRMNKKTQTKSKSRSRSRSTVKSMVDQARTGGLTKTFHRLKTGKYTIAKSITAVSPLSSWYGNASNYLYTGVGRQNSVGLEFGHVSDQAIYYQTATSGTALPAGSTSRNLWIKNIRVKFTFTNQSPGDAKLIIITYKYKNDTNNPATMHSEWINATGVEDYSGADSSYITIGNLPQRYKSVKDKYRVIDMDTINLSAGAHHEHISSWNINKMINMSKGTGSYATKETCIGIIFITHGYPVDNSLNAQIGGVVTTAPVKLIYTTVHQADFKLMSASPPTKVYREVNNFSAANNDYYQQDEKSGGPDNIFTAGGALVDYA